MCIVTECVSGRLSSFSASFRVSTASLTLERIEKKRFNVFNTLCEATPVDAASNLCMYLCMQVHIIEESFTCDDLCELERLDQHIRITLF